VNGEGDRRGAEGRKEGKERTLPTELARALLEVLAWLLLLTS